MSYQAPHYPPHQFAPPPKKHHVRNALIGITAGFVLIVGGCMAVVGGVANEVAKDIETPAVTPGQSKRDTRLPDKNQPTTVKVGQPVTKGSHRLEPGWKLRKEQHIDSFEVVAATVTNVSDHVSSAFFQVKVYRGTKVLASILCTSSDLEPGTSQDATCLPSGTYGSYDRVTIEATF